jgi:hypothetical protein
MVSSIFVFVFAARLGLLWPWAECSPWWVAALQVLAPEHHSDSDYVQLYAEHDIAGLTPSDVTACAYRVCSWAACNPLPMASSTVLLMRRARYLPASAPQ